MRVFNIPSSAPFLRTLVEALVDGRTLEAIDAFMIAKSFPEQAPAAFNGLAVAYSRLGRTDLTERFFQTAIALATYLGNNGTWGHRIFQKDLKVSGGSPLERTLDLLAQRKATEKSEEAGVSDMLRRGLMANAELAVMARKAEAPWRMGHGHPLPKELLTGAGMPELRAAMVKVMRERTS